MLRPLLALALLCMSAPDVVFAQDEMDEIMGGFEDEEPVVTHTERDDKAGFWELSGAAQLGVSYSYNQDHPSPGQPRYSGLSRLQLELDLELDLELPFEWKARIGGRGFRDYSYALEDRSEFPNPVLDAHERENEFREVWLQGSLTESLDLKFGRQIINWGRSDNLRVLDVLNPVDRREPGLVDVEDLRLPVTATRLDWFAGPWQLTGVAVHETRFDESPVPGSEFLPLVAGALSLPELVPANGGRDTEWAAALTGVFSGWDVSFHWARYYDDQVHAVGGFPLPTRLEHARLSLYGASAQLAIGNFLWKSELAYVRGLEFFEPVPEKRSRIDTLIGVEYSGIDDGSVSIELVNRHLNRFHSGLENALNQARRNRVEASVRLSQDFWNQTLHLTLIGITFGAHAQDGAVIRGQVSYDVRDAVVIEGGVVLYEEGDFFPFSELQHNDRLFFRARYSF